MNIYTKNGDGGYTFVPGKGHVSKSDVAVVALGELDELNAWIGVLMQLYPEHYGYSNLVSAQDVLMRIGAQLSGAGDLAGDLVRDDDVTVLELAIDMLEEDLEPLKNFILPGFPAEGHVARAVCRRAERGVLAWCDSVGGGDRFCWVVPYLNRLSDFLFVWCRSTCAADKRVEKKWILEK